MPATVNKVFLCKDCRRPLFPYEWKVLQRHLCPYCGGRYFTEALTVSIFSYPRYLYYKILWKIKEKFSLAPTS